MSDLDDKIKELTAEIITSVKEVAENDEEYEVILASLISSLENEMVLDEDDDNDDNDDNDDDDDDDEDVPID